MPHEQSDSGYKYLLRAKRFLLAEKPGFFILRRTITNALPKLVEENFLARLLPEDCFQFTSQNLIIDQNHP